jgi:hypothetical protein
MAYWASTLDRRISRRAALAIGGTAAGAAFLAACGGGNEDKQTGDKSSLVLKPQDETKTAKRGGIFKARNTLEPSTLDPERAPIKRA